FKAIKKEIKKSKNEDISDLQELYSKLYEVNSVKSSVFSSHFNHCPSIDIVRDFGYNLRTSIKLPFVEIIYALKIEKEFTVEECMKMLFMNSDYLNGNIGIKEASKYYFKMDLKDLSQREKLTLIAMFVNPSNFDPIRRPEKVKSKVALFEKIIKKQNKLKICTEKFNNTCKTN
ncbi:transglycosylase domain-containing protein, partial [Flavobacterium sp.]|uniref:transglycosylase domain-containing protein n=1 Tax=Flavobacterium sp. TaxID=239 RepID=UPI000EBB31A2